MHIYQSVFDNFFVSELIASNKIFLGRKNKMPSIIEIQNNADFWKNSFLTLNIDTNWLLNILCLHEKRTNLACDNNFKIYLVNNFCYHIDDI